MVERDVKIRIRMELDSGDKQAIRNEAKAVKETGSAPVQSSGAPQEFRGGIFSEDREDPGVKGRAKRTSIGGGVERLRDRTSRAPIDLRTSFEQFKEEQELNKKIISEQEKRITEQEKTLAQLISNPQAFIQDRIQSIFRNIPFVTTILTAAPVIAAILAAPQMVEGFISLLKSSRIIGVFQRHVLNERNPFLTREQQRARLIGEDAAIFSNTHGFTSSNANLTTNTLSQVRANGISDIGLRDKAGGLF